MDIRQLHYFLVLCEEMNYTRASQRLFRLVDFFEQYEG